MNTFHSRCCCLIMIKKKVFRCMPITIWSKREKKTFHVRYVHISIRKNAKIFPLCNSTILIFIIRNFASELMFSLESLLSLLSSRFVFMFSFFVLSFFFGSRLKEIEQSEVVPYFCLSHSAWYVKIKQIPFMSLAFLFSRFFTYHAKISSEREKFIKRFKFDEILRNVFNSIIIFQEKPQESIIKNITNK